jgi:hypothetical protein
VLVDPGQPGMGASYGNAGTIAGYATSPVGTPGVLRSLPSLMLSKTSPLAIRHRALPSLAPWLMRFLWQSLPAQAARNARALASLLSGAAEQWDDLALRVQGAGILVYRFIGRRLGRGLGTGLAARNDCQGDQARSEHAGAGQPVAGQGGARQVAVHGGSPVVVGRFNAPCSVMGLSDSKAA